MALVESIPVKITHPGISIQQAYVDLRLELRLCLGISMDDGSNMRLMNAHDAILHLMVPLPVHGLLLFQQVPDDKEIFQLLPLERSLFFLYGVQHLVARMRIGVVITIIIILRIRVNPFRFCFGF